MATNRDIVATRKLNENRKASLGRRGDTKIREVGGRKSHVTALEAYRIDVDGKAGEEYAQRVGAGTVNPLTGMPEYHDKETNAEDDDPAYPQGHIHLGADVTVGKGERQDYDFLKSLSENQLANYLGATFGKTGMQDKMQWLEGFQEEPFGYIGEEYSQASYQAGVTRGEERERAMFDFKTTMGELGSEKEALGLQRKGLGLKTQGLTAQQGVLGRSTARGLTQARGSSDIAASRSGLATSGTITQGYEAQTKNLFQDYTAGSKDIQRQKAGVQLEQRGVDLGFRDITRKEGTAQKGRILSQEEAQTKYVSTIRGADLDRRRSEYDEKKRQLDELYADIAAVPAYGPE